jgi:hypothetical protein
MAGQAGESEQKPDPEPRPRVEVVAALLNPRDEEAEAAEMFEPSLHRAERCHEARRYDDRRGAVAEWLGRGLQSLAHQFDSGRRLYLTRER